MNKKKSTKAQKARVQKMKSLSLWLVVGVLGLSLFAGVVRASGSDFSWSSVEDKVAQKIYDSMNSIDEMLGGSGTRFPNGISADTTSPVEGEVRGTTLTMTDSATLVDFTATGDNRATSFVKTGAVASFTVSATASAANVCDNPLWAVSPPGAEQTITLPATTTLFADCLTTIGDTISFNVKAIATSTVMAVGSGGNLDLDSTATITADKSAKVTIIRDATATYLMQVDNYNS